MWNFKILTKRLAVMTTKEFVFPTTESPAITEKNETISASILLDKVKSRVETKNEQTRLVSVFDLDATLFDNRPRIMKILKDTVTENEDKVPDGTEELIDSIQPEKMHYLVKETLITAGLEDEELLDFFFEEWWKRFFTNKYVVCDIPTSGSQQFVESILEMDVSIIYLTGRDTPGMRQGTLASLKEHGFPVPDDKNVYLITKPTFEETDLLFKQNAIEQIKQIGEVLLTFDNEPKMNNVLAESFPEAINVFLDTMHSPDIEPLKPGILILNSFQLT